MKKYLFPIIITLAAISVSLSAAFYSIHGLSKLFSGAGIAIIIMASSLEAAKLIVASLLHQYWKVLNKLLKIYLCIALGVLMLITSLGIYGFLTASYQSVYNQSLLIENESKSYISKIEYFEKNISLINEQITQKNTKINNFISLRSQQEIRLDSLYNKKAYSSAKKTLKLITDNDLEIKKLEEELKPLYIEITNLNDSINVYDYKILEINNSNEAAAELGPLKYVSTLLDKPMDEIINWYMLLIIFVFDPLAISLVLVANFAFKQIPKKELKIYNQPPIIESTVSPEPQNVNNVIKKFNNIKKEEKDIKDNIQNNKNQEEEKHRILSMGLSEKRRNQMLEDLTKTY